MPESVKIKIPATTANLGPGFDILGIALNLYNFLELKNSDRDKIIVSGIHGGQNIPTDTNNLIYKSVKRIFDELDLKIPELELNVEINIPLSRGLGSSSSAIAGGIFAANRLLGNKLTVEELLNIASEIEGHPDNVAPCLLGGIIISLCENNKVYTQKLHTKLPLKFIALVPEFELSTEKARMILPKEVPFRDAVFNSSHLAFLIAGLIHNNAGLLKLSLHDRLHEQYRGPLIIGFEEVKRVAVENGAIGSVLSGAGPTILALSVENEENIAKAMQAKWMEYGIKSGYKLLEIDNTGIQIIEQ